MSFRYLSMQHSEENKQCLNFQQKSVEMVELLHCTLSYLWLSLRAVLTGGLCKQTLI